MLDVGWICGAAVRAVYWLVMLVCNFMGYSPLWAQNAMKQRKMENEKLRIPMHLAVLFTESRLVKMDEMMELIDSAIVAGIRNLSLYDPFNELHGRSTEIRILCKHMNVDLLSDGRLLYESPRSKMQVHVLSKKMGKAALVEVCKILCKRNEPITTEKVTAVLSENFKLTDPDFLLQIGNVPSLCGYPPWNLRITEFLQCPRLPSSRRALDHCIESYSQRDIRVDLMGLLTKGSPLTWDETVPYVDYIKKHGIAQFINLFHRLKSRQGDQLKWGDEIEYTILKFDHEKKKVHVSCRAEEMLNRLGAEEQVNAMLGTANRFLWRPEFGSYMIEGTPGVPYGGLIACFNIVEANMKVRRDVVKKLLKKDESVLSISFPSLGVPGFTWPEYKANGKNAEAANSIFWPEEAVFLGHPRFKNLTKNIKGRRGSKVAINVPIFKDTNTPSPYVEDFSAFGSAEEDTKDAKPDHIYMDHMGFGMGCCCLQVTFQAVNVDEARWLYDQLTPITPILLALSAATPIFRGKLSNVDSRWDIISASVDDRTREERGLEPLKNSKWVIEKSRYDSTDCYLYPCSVGYNDIPLQYDEGIYQQLIDGKIDEPLAKHIAHMFIRDPHQVFRERIEQDDEKSSEHFETIQSSNWMNMRFKPPPPDAPEIGWRVEFRPTEVQLTDFENAAYCCFVVLLTRMIISFRLTYLMPISMVTENMKRAQQKDAVLNQKFLFRKGLAECKSAPENLKGSSGECGPPSSDIEEMSIAEIINGKQNGFPGLISLIRQFLDSADVDVDTRCTISQYLNFISKRATGEIQTLAHWTREFVQSHESYKHDSDVNDTIIYDLLVKMDAISNGEDHCTKLLGCYRSKTDHSISAAVRKAEEHMMFQSQKRGGH